MLKTLTSTELADVLGGVQCQSPELTGPLSMLDEATLGWTSRYPQLAESQQAFSRARRQHFPRTRTEQTRQEVVATASALFAALRELGDVRLERCAEPTGWGTCDLVLPEQGPCWGGQEHLAPAVGSKAAQ
ncbi:hypothetical protein ABZ023_33760 [Streptomyces sp. NPDC006367]|uniref:hypothetical protein n=1 Tax=unclassified Streptomyces TaxID=2593676 RepID=UPI0033A6A230